MGIFKEDVRYFEDLAREQKQIWDDSADVGIPLTVDNRENIRSIITSLLKLPGSKIVWGADKPAVQRHYKLFVIWEKDGANVSGTEIDVLYYKDRSKEFITINSIHPEIKKATLL